MTYDLLLAGGTVVDGTGRPAFVGDLAISGRRIAALGDVDGSARRIINASGLVVCPGFIDPHTHLDAQLFGWDPTGSSSCWHGITSVVIGNCGVTLAPCRPADRRYLAELMESVEELPSGIVFDASAWRGERPAEYFAWLESAPKGVNVGALVGHCAVRLWAMGARCRSRLPAADDDIGRMVDVVGDALCSGALGFSTSRWPQHRDAASAAVPGTYAREDELYAIARQCRTRRGMIAVAANWGSTDSGLERVRAEVALMAEISRVSGSPVTFGLVQSDRRGDLWSDILDLVDDAVEHGADLRPQTIPGPVRALFTLGGRTPFDNAPAWRVLHGLDLAQRFKLITQPATRAELVRSAESSGLGIVEPGSLCLLPTGFVRAGFDDGCSLAELASVAGESPAETFLRISESTRGRAVFAVSLGNQRDDAVTAMLRHPRVVLGLGDSGAHLSTMIGAGFTTTFLAEWVRDRGVFSIEEGVRRLTSDIASLLGLPDRGVLREGAFADVNLIDMSALALDPVEFVNDLPGGAGRFIQRAAGYEYTIVNGETFMEHGDHTGAFPGVLLRS